MSEQQKFGGDAGFISRVADWFGISGADADALPNADEGADDWMLGAEGWVHSANQADGRRRSARVSL